MGNLLSVLSVAMAVASVGCGGGGAPTGPSALVSNAPAGLTNSSVTAPQAETAAAARTREIALSGELDGDFNATPTDDPAVAEVHLMATGTAPHIGRFTFLSDHRVDFRSLEGVGTAALIAAGSGTLTGTETGKAKSGALPGTFDIEETFEVTGGTGRFAGASGTIFITRSTTPPGPDGGSTSGSFHGTITLPIGQP